ncbi:LLM class flavin-dependent oxidoreductase [Achromobacter mucicolens]|jgi:alkanesulfonate monooxygenase SsuD/methylene tetrahydromethanopterin reductase-like flavin-dependent oxidoreductase (luciferase family)|uniref:LLM class flavin-dependent oxidoreductase n=1 Tax=Achromobacter mucicolens TaxID=1389922 RepID=UPI0009CDBDD4|nr:LLM class flavin-dependent oxidoreductase [Achromobacter mucicolens]MDG9967091.1 LLM class flavin-dependent oxidoreductase [Achromobacter mucicolens]OXC89856.1 LLM class flavin-dependent oxidoreductase [Achromobacter sp. KAs 3-5]PTX04482.1 LLM class flavin-dependent oxidoreductase [Achromobacter mucicolens]CAB3625145.1 Flavin-dependent trigonelline monooxygenase, oxygenase component [Achromobacter mucicolens]
MEFGVFILAQQRGYHQSSAQVINNSIEQTVAAEQAGFNTAWYAEHHFNNYSLSPSPLMTVAHAAAKTRRIRLGTAVCILPLYHPARFLAEVGFVDTVSNGRLDLGVGSGYQQFEFERFGVQIEESGAIFNEFLDVIPKGLTQKIFEHDGKFLKIPPSSIAVRCVQDPMPPLWITSGNPVTLGRGVRENHNLFVTALLKGNDAIAELRGRLEKVAEDNGKDLDRDVKFGFLRCGYASDNKAEIDAYLDCARFQRRISESLKFRRAQSDDGYMVKEVPSETDPTFEQLRKNLPVGSVNEVIDKMLEEISILRPKHIALQTQLGDFDQKTMLKQIELWGDKIIPAIRKEVGSTTVLA